MRALPRSFDPILTIGLIVSGAISLTLVLLGQDQILSLLVGLTTTIATLLIDLIARLKETERKLSELNILGASIAGDKWLLQIIRDMIDSYHTADQEWFEFFRQRAKASLVDCRDTLHNIAEGYMNIPIGSKFTYGLDGIRQAQSNVKAVAYASPSWWRSLAGQRYLQGNIETVKKGVAFTRVFLQERRLLKEFEDIIESQSISGIKVLTADPTECPQELLGDYVIIDDRILVRLEIALDGRPREERVIIEPVQVSKAVKRFEDLLYSAEVFDSKVLPGQTELEGVVNDKPK